MLEAAAKFGAEFTVQHCTEEKRCTFFLKLSNLSNPSQATKNQKFQRTERTCGQEGHLVA